MIMASLEFMGDVPFTDVYFNGMIRDLSGRKMSKSLGNSPDPLWLIEGIEASAIKDFASENPSYKQGVPAYGADAIRMTMIYLTPLGGDIHFDHTLVEMGQKFCNKLWNASRFVLMNLDDDQAFISPNDLNSNMLDLADRWILSRLQRTIESVRKGYGTFKLNESAHVLHGFIWGEFCDWYLELIKARLYDQENSESRKAAQSVVLFVLESIMRLLHPIMPFISEEIWQALPKLSNSELETIMMQSYPQVDAGWVDEESEKQMQFVQQVIGAIRNIRGEMNVPQDRKAKAILRGSEDKLKMVEPYQDFIRRLAMVESIEMGASVLKPKDAAVGMAGDLEIFLPLEGLIDLDVERDRIQKEITRIEGQLTGFEKKLGNEQFVGKAPKEVVDKERNKQADFTEKLQKLKENMALLGN
ncbi:class I tRNA ligase family protein, partial [candidate division KSB1 bacterium]|nr:class I tRNA ligase family protein [candidate division KSB1 bacterium]